jgi:transposase
VNSGSATRRIDPNRLCSSAKDLGQDQRDAAARAQRGERLKATARSGAGRRDLIAACSDHIDPPCLFDGPISRAFLAYVQTFLVPALKQGDVVILDNLGSHRGKAVRRTIRAAGAKLLFLPKYSPDLNPIEQVFSKLKHMLRKAKARSYDAILSAIAELLDTYAPAECRNYLANSGYGVV